MKRNSERVGRSIRTGALIASYLVSLKDTFLTTEGRASCTSAQLNRVRDAKIEVLRGQAEEKRRSALLQTRTVETT